jgi:hypothetical protein
MYGPPAGNASHDRISRLDRSIAQTLVKSPADDGRRRH